MGKCVARQLIEKHLVGGSLTAGSDLSIRIDQTLAQDATGTLVMLEFDAMGLPRVKTELSAQYVDHNLLQEDFKNPDDHLFLLSACRKFGVWFSKPGNGVSHVVHMERFGIPGKTLLGSDSHTCAAGCLGMLAIGAGGLEVAMAMAGEPFHLKMPRVLGVNVTGRLSEGVSAKDVVLEMLRRHGVDGGLGRIIEYHGPGLDNLTAMDRHVISNMGAEMGATTTVFPSDFEIKRFLDTQGRGDAWQELIAEDDAQYDENKELDLSEIEPLIALPHSPGNVARVRDVAGRKIYQAYIGSSANPGFRDFAVAAQMVDGKQVDSGVSFDITPSSRQVLNEMIESGVLGALVKSGARIHQAGCGGCIGMGQAPATGRISLRTVPRNFPGRSGTKDDLVYLCSPETAAASALTGKITDPRDVGSGTRRFKNSAPKGGNSETIEAPSHSNEVIELDKGPNIRPLPVFEPLPHRIEAPVLLKVGDNISTDEIMPAGAKVLPYRSNIPEISRFTFAPIDETYYERAKEFQKQGSIVVAGANYGQGSSREHAVLAPRYLGLCAVVAKSFARIHHQNLVNFGVLPLLFKDARDWERIEQNDKLLIDRVSDTILASPLVKVVDVTRSFEFLTMHQLSVRQSEILVAGGYFNWMQMSRLHPEKRGAA